MKKKTKKLLYVITIALALVLTSFVTGVQAQTVKSDISAADGVPTVDVSAIKKWDGPKGNDPTFELIQIPWTYGHPITIGAYKLSYETPIVMWSYVEQIGAWKQP